MNLNRKKMKNLEISGMEKLKKKILRLTMNIIKMIIINSPIHVK